MLRQRLTLASSTLTVLLGLSANAAEPIPPRLGPTPSTEVTDEGTTEPDATEVQIVDGQVVRPSYMGREYNLSETESAQQFFDALDAYADQAQTQGLVDTYSTDKRVALFSELDVEGLARGSAGSYEISGNTIRLNERDFIPAESGRSYVYSDQPNGMTIALLAEESSGQAIGWVSSPSHDYVVRPVPLLADQDQVASTASAEEWRRQHLAIRSEPTQAHRDFADGPHGEQPDLSEKRDRECFQPRDDEIYRPARVWDSVEVDGDLSVYFEYTKSAREKSEAINGNVDVVGLITEMKYDLVMALQDAGVQISRSQVVFRYHRSAFSDTEHSKVALEKIVCELALAEPGGTSEFSGFQLRRQQLRADIGVLVIHRDDPTECGYVPHVAGRAKFGVAILNWQCMGTAWVLLHELGHILGAQHEEVFYKIYPEFARAYISDETEPTYRTVMGLSTNCGTIACSHRYRFYSNPDQDFDHGPLGDARRNNAKAVRANIDRVSNFGLYLSGLKNPNL